MASSPRPKVAYWVTVLALIGFGYLAAFSIGGIFWFIALVMIVLSPFRSRPRFFKTGVALFGGFLLGYVLTAPFGCTQSESFDVRTGEEFVSPVVCTSPAGIEYSGPEPFDPSSTPALVVGAITALVASITVWLVSKPRVDEEGVEPTDR